VASSAATESSSSLVDEPLRLASGSVPCSAQLLADEQTHSCGHCSVVRGREPRRGRRLPPTACRVIVRAVVAVDSHEIVRTWQPCCLIAMPTHVRCRQSATGSRAPYGKLSSMTESHIADNAPTPKAVVRQTSPEKAPTRGIPVVPSLLPPRSGTDRMQSVPAIGKEPITVESESRDRETKGRCSPQDLPRDGLQDGAG
jgi:hypothetical protein